VDDEVAPLRRGTQANPRTASLSGVANRYVDLQMPPGEAPETIPDGGVIPVEDTTTAVDLDHVFALFDEKTRKGLRNVIRGFGAS
jgi:phospholipid/cholesterol/gamma-HCH transport system substrate-binding protein